MQYIEIKKVEMSNLLRILNNNESLKKYNEVIYTKNELQMMINRTQRQIDGYKRVHANLRNKSITLKEFALFSALAIKEHEYFLEVENRIDTFTSTKLLSLMSHDKYEETFNMIKNINKKIAKRSTSIARSKWIEDRTFEIGSVADVRGFEFISESLYNINCLDSLMSGKMSKSELEKAGLWKSIHEDNTDSIYVEAGNLLRHKESKIVVP